MYSSHSVHSPHPAHTGHSAHHAANHSGHSAHAHTGHSEDDREIRYSSEREVSTIVSFSLCAVLIKFNHLLLCIIIPDSSGTNGAGSRSSTFLQPSSRFFSKY